MLERSEVEFRVAREAWHLELAIDARSLDAAIRHAEMARRYADYDYSLPGIVDINQVSEESPFAAPLHAKVKRGPLRSPLSVVGLVSRIAQFSTASA